MIKGRAPNVRERAAMADSTTARDPTAFANHRVLVIDDNPAIHQDFDKILGSPQNHAGLSEAERILFGDTTAPVERPTFQIEFALQGQQGAQRVADALANGRPFAMAFVDMRMPPGWDGLETIEHLWAADPD